MPSVQQFIIESRIFMLELLGEGVGCTQIPSVANMRDKGFSKHTLIEIFPLRKYTLNKIFFFVAFLHPLLPLITKICRENKGFVEQRALKNYFLINLAEFKNKYTRNIFFFHFHTHFYPLTRIAGNIKALWNRCFLNDTFKCPKQNFKIKDLFS